VEGDETGEFHMSQSTTDTGIQIKLPEGGAKSVTLDRSGVTNVDGQADAGNMTDGSETPGYIATPVQTNFEKGKKLTARTNEWVTETAKVSLAEIRNSVTPGGVVLSEFKRMMKEIDASELMQEELRKIDPTLASASFFLSVVTGGAGRKKISKKAEDAPPIVQKKAEDAPVVQKKAEDPPVLQKQAEDAPVVQKQAEDAHVVQKQAENAPVVQRKAKRTEVV